MASHRNSRPNQPQTYRSSNSVGTQRTESPRHTPRESPPKKRNTIPRNRTTCPGLHTPMNTANSDFQLIRSIWRELSRKRKHQFLGLLILMTFGAISEFLLVGIVGKFLSVMTQESTPTQQNISLLSDLSEAIGITHHRLFYTLLFCGIIIISTLIRTTLLWANSRYGMQIGYDFSSRIYANIVCNSYADHLKSTSSTEIAAVEKVQAVTIAVIIPLLRALTATIVTTFILASLCFISPGLAATVMGTVGGLYFLAVISTRPLLITNSQHIAAARTARVRMVQEGVAGIRDIIINNLHDCYQKRFNLVESNFRLRSATNAFLSQVPRFLIELIILITIAVGVFLHIESGKKIDNLIPLFGAFLIGILRLFPLLQTIYRAQASISGNQGIVSDVLKSARTKPGHDHNHVHPTSLPFNNKIELANLRFRYNPDSPDILRDVNLVIKKGQFINIVGNTGSGKSTLIDLILGLLLPTNGTISIDENILKSQELVAGWWQNIAHVPQDIFLIEASIAENIALGFNEHEIDKDRLHEAIRIAELTDIIEKLPQTIYTMVGERGTNLSGGQKQRIGIARAIYLRRPVLVLDEATSSLDTKTESRIFKNIRSIKGITIISITHHPTDTNHPDATFNVHNESVNPTYHPTKAKT